jgi:hypothetical protein
MFEFFYSLEFTVHQFHGVMSIQFRTNKAPRSPVSVVLLWDMSYLLFELAFSNRSLHALWVYDPVVRIGLRSRLDKIDLNGKYRSLTLCSSTHIVVHEERCDKLLDFKKGDVLAQTTSCPGPELVQSDIERTREVG